MPWRYVRILTNFTCITTYNIDRGHLYFPVKFFSIEKPSGFFQGVFMLDWRKNEAQVLARNE